MRDSTVTNPDFCGCPGANKAEDKHPFEDIVCIFYVLYLFLQRNAVIKCFGWVKGVDGVNLRVEKSECIFVIPLFPTKWGYPVNVVVFKESD